MQPPEKQGHSIERFISIRKLAALDIVFHGATLILLEFVLAVILCGFFGVFSLLVFLRNPGHPLFSAIVGIVLLWVALNYVPLLLYAISIVRRKSASSEVAFELEHKDLYARKYTLQSFFLLLPFAVLILALYQEIQKRLHS